MDQAGCWVYFEIARDWFDYGVSVSIISVDVGARTGRVSACHCGAQSLAHGLS